MSDYSWLEPMERRTREIRQETQRIKDETEKMKQETHNLPVPDDAPWLNLSQEEVEELRNKKHELTEYGKQKLRELMDKEAERKAIEAVEKLYAENGEALKQLAEKLKND
jgi:hypothetical protein